MHESLPEQPVGMSNAVRDHFDPFFAAKQSAPHKMEAKGIETRWPTYLKIEKII